MESTLSDSSDTSADKLVEPPQNTGNLYPVELTHGQRKYGGPPPDWQGPTPPVKGNEIYCGRIPNDIYEDNLIPIFEKHGKIWDLRLMVDPVTKTSKGYCFVTYCEQSSAEKAVDELNGWEIRPGHTLKVNMSLANTRLFVGNIPKNKSRDEIEDEFSKLSDGLIDVIIYQTADDKRKKNRGFCFLEYENHHAASMAKRRLGSGRFRVWNCDILVDWADPLVEPDPDVMQKVKILYVSNLTADVTEEALRRVFCRFGEVERVKIIRDYAFIHFIQRDDALKALAEMNGKRIGQNEVTITLAKPPTEAYQRRKEHRQRETDLRKQLTAAGLDPYLLMTEKGREQLIRQRHIQQQQIGLHNQQQAENVSAAVLNNAVAAAAYGSQTGLGVSPQPSVSMLPGRDYNNYSYDSYGLGDYSGGYTPFSLAANHHQATNPRGPNVLGPSALPRSATALSDVGLYDDFCYGLYSALDSCYDPPTALGPLASIPSFSPSMSSVGGIPNAAPAGSELGGFIPGLPSTHPLNIRPPPTNMPFIPPPSRIPPPRLPPLIPSSSGSSANLTAAGSAGNHPAQQRSSQTALGSTAGGFSAGRQGFNPPVSGPKSRRTMPNSSGPPMRTGGLQNSLAAMSPAFRQLRRRVGSGRIQHPVY